MNNKIPTHENMIVLKQILNLFLRNYQPARLRKWRGSHSPHLQRPEPSHGDVLRPTPLRYWPQRCLRLALAQIGSALVL